MKSKQQAYTHIVKSTWNQALSRSRKQGYDGKAVLVRRHDVTGSDLPYLPPYYSLAVPYLKVSIMIKTTAACVYANEQSGLVVILCFTSENYTYTIIRLRLGEHWWDEVEVNIHVC